MFSSPAFEPSTLGRCKTLDASADGYVRGEACLAAYLQRCGGDVQEDGTAPSVLLCSGATNQDGRSSALTAPNGPAQQAVILAALAAAALDAASLAGTLHRMLTLCDAACGCSVTVSLP